MSSEILLKVSHLEKNFGSFKAVDDISFEVKKGDIYGFLGPNGAGKSTTLRMILGLIKPEKGNIEINNESIFGNKRSYLKKIGALIERPDFHKNLTGYQNLKILYKLSRLNDKDRINEVLKNVGLFEKKNQKVGGYSQGMKQRLGIAQALLHKPNLIILDEPSNGLDPQGQADMRSLILNINQTMGITVIISSHILSEIEKISNRMIVINNGKKIIEGKVKDLMNNDSLKVCFKSNNINKLEEIFKTLEKKFVTEENKITISTKEEEINSIVQYITSKNVNIQEVKQLRTLEELFLDLTK